MRRLSAALAFVAAIGCAGAAAAGDQTPLYALHSHPAEFQPGDTVGVAHGGTGAATFTSHCVLIGEGTSAFHVACPSSSGQVLTDNGASSDPTFQAPTGGTPDLTGSTGIVAQTGASSYAARTVSGSGLVSVSNGSGVSGNPTVSLSSIGAGDLVANATGSSAAPADTTLTAEIDQALGNVQGDILYRDSSAWQVLTPGTSGQFLETQGASANPAWANPGTGSGAGGGGPTGCNGATPCTIADLVYWLKTDTLTPLSNSAAVLVFNNYNPFNTSEWAALNGSTGAVISSTTLNGLKTVDFPGTSNGRYANFAAMSGIGNGGITIFAVVKPNSLAALSAIVCGSSNAPALDILTTGALRFDACNIAILGTSTTTLTAGTWYQVNVTYNPSTGAGAFRVAQAGAGTFTNAHTISAASNGLAYNGAAGNSDCNCSLAELIVYERVLTGTEISNVESYLHTKWGV